EAARVQGDDTITRQLSGRAESALSPVDQITQNRPAAHRRLHANLVHASGLRFNLQQRAVRPGFQTAIPQQRLPCSRGFRGDDLSPGLLRQLEQPVFPAAFRRLNLSLDDGPVNLANGALLKLLGQTPCRLGVAGKQYDPGYRTIEAVGNAEIDAAG